MERIIAINSVPLSGADTAPVSGTPQYATSGNPALGIPATQFPAYAWNMLQEEMMSILAAAGISSDRTNNGQIVAAIESLIEVRSGNYALDTGVANAYVVALNPAIAAYTNGLSIRLKFAHSNTGAATINAGAGVVPLLNDEGSALVAGDAPAGGVASAVYDATAGGFLITGLVPSQALSEAAADARYAAISFAQVQQPLTAAATLTEAQCQGQSYYVTGAGTYTLPSSGGAKVKFSCGIAGVVIAAPTGVNLLSPSGSATTAGSITLKPYQDISLEWNGTAWSITGGNFCNMVSGVDTDVTASRVYGTSPTTYTNTSPFPRRCAITVTTSTTAGASLFGVTVNGRPYWTNPYATAVSAGIAVDVLPGETYSYYVSNATVGSIRETL